MADINQVVTLGIGTPSDIEHFILFGLNGAVDNPIAGTGDVRKIYAQAVETIEAQDAPYIRAAKVMDIEA